MMDWLVYRIPFLRRRREAEIHAWAEYAKAQFEASLLFQPPEIQEAMRASWRRQWHEMAERAR